MIPALFRGSLWLAALAAGGAALAPDDSSAWLSAIAGAAALSAWWLWRSGQAPRAVLMHADAGLPAPPPLQIDGAALQEVEARIRELASGATSLDQALHDAANILKSELGAVDARVYRVKPALLGAHAPPRITELIATPGGFRPAGEVTAGGRPSTDGSPLVIAIRRKLAVLALPDAVALPIVCADAVVAALALGDLAIPIDDDALHRLLTLTASTLAEIAARGAANPARLDDGETGATDDSQFHRAGFDGSPTPPPLRHGPPPTMLTRRSPPQAPAPDPAGAPTGGAGATAATVLDATALARLAELDPGGKSRLLPRVLTAYLSSVARLHPQLIAARPKPDLEAIRHVTHTLKSSSASIGALQLAAICAEIDAMIRTANTATLAPHLDSMDAELDRVLKAVKHLLDGLP